MQSGIYGKPLIYFNRTSERLAKKIAKINNYPIAQAVAKNFSDGEMQIRLGADTRDRDVFIVASTHQPDRNLLELLGITRAVKKASAQRITVILTYAGYSRQDYKDAPRVCPTTRLICDIIDTAGANRLLTLDLHSPQIQEFFPANVAVDQLYASSLFYTKLNGDIDWQNYIIAAPDANALKTGRKLFNRVIKDTGKSPAGLAFINKFRPKPNESLEVTTINMEAGISIEGRNVLIIDDIIDTGGTIIKGTKKFKDDGASFIHVMCTHGVLSGNAVKALKKAPIDRFWLTDSISTTAKKIIKTLPYQVDIISINEMMAEGIRRIHTGESISSMILM